MFLFLYLFCVVFSGICLTNFAFLSRLFSFKNLEYLSLDNLCSFLEIFSEIFLDFWTIFLDTILERDSLINI